MLHGGNPDPPSVPPFPPGVFPPLWSPRGRGTEGGGFFSSPPFSLPVSYPPSTGDNRGVEGRGGGRPGGGQNFRRCVLGLGSSWPIYLYQFAIDNLKLTVTNAFVVRNGINQLLDQPLALFRIVVRGRTKSLPPNF